jgi:Ca-activated chloride channel homolog
MRHRWTVVTKREALAFVVLIAACVGACTAKADDQRRAELLQAAMTGIPEGGEQTLSPYFFVLSDDPETDRLPLKETRADVTVAGVIAQVDVTQVYANDGDTTLEAIYIFPMSTRAAVHGMTMTVGERLIEARIRERDEAREEYEEARSNGQTASLLEQQRPNVFQMNVANILPGDEIVVEMSYVELLVPEDAVYEFVFPTVVGPRYCNMPASEAPASESWVENPYLHEGEDAFHTFGADLWIQSGIPIARASSPSHDLDVEFIDARRVHLHLADGPDVGNRDLVLRYALAGDDIESGVLIYEGEEESFFLTMVEPPARVEPDRIVPREYIFILDVSGSMNGFPLDTTRELMDELLGSLRPSDHFNILTFAGSSGLLAEESLPATRENIDLALGRIQQLRGGGGTELLPALERALALPRAEGTSRVVVVATDGYVTVEKQAFHVISERLGEANMFPFGIGSSVNRHLIEGMARAGLGEPFVVLDGGEAAEKADRFREYISAPVLQGIEVEFGGIDAYDVEPPAAPDLFASRPVVVFGKFEGPAEGEIVVSGYTSEGLVEICLDLGDALVSDDHEALRYLWARHRIRRLSDLNSFGEDEEAVAEVTRLGLDYSLMTQYTSFVAVDRVVRADGEYETVDQPLPLPEGVSDLAVGGKQLQSGTLGGIIGTQYGNSYGSGGLGSRGSGLGGGGTGEGLGGLTTRGRGRGSSGYGAGNSAPATPSVGSPIILGSVDKTQVDRTIKQHLAQIRYCYQKELNKNPALAGKVVVKFTIGADGTVTAAEIKSSTLNNETVEACICARFMRMTFPAPAGGGVVVVSYPFVFKPAP